MSDENVMVPITYSVTLEKLKAMASGYACVGEVERLAAQLALKVRGSLYDKWRERIRPHGGRWQPSTLQHLHGDEAGKLMAAAPQLLKALIEMHKILDLWMPPDGRPYPHPDICEKAIRAAVPENVADEILSGGR